MTVELIVTRLRVRRDGVILLPDPGPVTPGSLAKGGCRAPAHPCVCPACNRDALVARHAQSLFEHADDLHLSLVRAGHRLRGALLGLSPRESDGPAARELHRDELAAAVAAVLWQQQLRQMVRGGPGSGSRGARLISVADSIDGLSGYPGNRVSAAFRLDDHTVLDRLGRR